MKHSHSLWQLVAAILLSYAAFEAHGRSQEIGDLSEAIADALSRAEIPVSVQLDVSNPSGQVVGFMSNTAPRWARGERNEGVIPVLAFG